MIEDKELAQLFKAESAEHLARLDDGMLRLEKTPGDTALLEELFREAHSMKGASRMLGLTGIESASQDLEGILNSARKGETALSVETIRRMTAELVRIGSLVGEALAQNSQTVAQEIKPAETAIPDRQADAPPPDATAPKQTAAFRIDTVRVATGQLDELLTLTGEISVIRGRGRHRLELMDELVEQWTMFERRKTPLRANAAAPIRFNSGSTDIGIAHSTNAALERMGKQLRLTRDALYEDTLRLESIIDSLQAQVYDIRLLPLSTVFALFPRMVHDIALEQGKLAELQISGEDIRVDKRILEEMKDPLMHMLRNAVDHGIESPAERARAGKPECGTVQLSAQREGGSVLLNIRDDGSGLDMDAIRHTALQRRLIDDAALAEMTAAQLQQLIFLPGFSTSAYVTQMSGRGVGLDVVRVNVESLKGEVQIETRPGSGTTLQVRLPLSLATTRLLLMRMDGRHYGVPIEFVHSSLQVFEKDIFTLEGHRSMELDGAALMLMPLAELLSLPAKTQGAAVCVVVQAGDEKLGILVDELLDEEEVVSKPLGAPLRRVRNVSGLCILGNGEICVALNPTDLIRSARQLRSAPYAASPEQAEVRAESPAVLLVEDSALVRVMEKRILEDAGYEVVVAVDGVDGLNALGQRSFSAVVSDISMPNMDGLALTERIRNDPRYKDLPVILVTALSTDADKRRGLDVGANAYIPKPSFDQHVLVETLKRLI